MTSPRFQLICAFSILLLLAGAAMCPAADRVDFNFQIRPLLSDRCFRCHGPDEKARKAKMRLDNRDGALMQLDRGMAVITPGSPDKSDLVRRIFTTNTDDLMPPPASNLSLSAAEKELLRRWIVEGAEFKPHWAFISVGTVEPPKVKNSGAVENPIDAFVIEQLEKENLDPAPPADKETLLRRLAFDLTGLPPAVAEIDAFLADQSHDAYARVVDKYLNSPAYGERMAQDWLDLARYADTYGYQADVDCDLSPWRDWVIKAFNENLPYDKFLLWQVAGDLLPNATREQRLATAFNRLHRQTNEGGSVEEEFRAEYCSDRVNTFGTAMLGLTVGCARCHDHKYDPISQRNYYSLVALFDNIDESGLYSHFTRAIPTPTLLLWPDTKAAEDTALKDKIAATEKQLDQIRAAARAEFASWVASGGKIAAPKPIAHFTFDAISHNTIRDSVNPADSADLVDDPKLVPGHDGNALQFSGDNEVVCKAVPNFRRTDPFTFALWLKPAEIQDRAVVLHQSRAWTDSGSRGFELVLDHGKPFFGLIHFWPGNAIGVRATRALATNEWSQVAVTYDGSSRAAGIHLYLDGAPLETEMVRDNLYKDIIHRGEWGDAEAGGIRLTLAGRFRDNGFKNGSIDDLRIFDEALTGAEIKNQLNDDASTGDFDYFLARRHDPYRAALAELKKLRESENALIDDIPEIMTMAEMPAQRPTFVLKRGAYDAPGDPVGPDTPASVMPFPKDQPRNRLGLGRWLVDRKNPLAARVAVNRIWKMHFGRGIVATPEDFGSQGKLPSHPELLDWLAGWFMDHDWDVKGVHRLIVTSATYRQSSLASRELVARDPDNILLARGPEQRLPAEEIRDSALAASGLLNRTIGGQSVKPYQPAGLWEQSGTGKSYSQDHGDKLYRRSLYTFWRRTAPPPSMLTFDATSREVCTAKREVTTTPLQALVLLDDPQFIEAARALAEKLTREFPVDVDARIRGAFKALAGRPPDTTETAVLRRLFDEQKNFYTNTPGAADKILATGESKWDESLPRPEFAATTMLVSAVMNYDEFVITR